MVRVFESRHQNLGFPCELDSVTAVVDSVSTITRIVPKFLLHAGRSRSSEGTFSGLTKKNKVKKVSFSPRRIPLGNSNVFLHAIFMSIRAPSTSANKNNEKKKFMHYYSTGSSTSCTILLWKHFLL